MKKEDSKEKKPKKKRNSTTKPIDSPVRTTPALPGQKEEEDEKPAPVPEPVVIPGPKGYKPFMSLERAATIHKSGTELWAHLPESKPFVDEVSERGRARQEIIYELISTEELYISDLELIIRVCPLFLSILSPFLFVNSSFHSEHRSS